jgi:hypothetical protein
MKQQDTYNQVQPLKGRTNYKLPKTKSTMEQQEGIPKT